MINKDLDLLLLSKLLPNDDNNNLIIPIKLKNNEQIKQLEFINMNSIDIPTMSNYFNSTFLLFNGGLNVAKLLFIDINDNSSARSFMNNSAAKSMSSIKNYLNVEGKLAVIACTPFSNVNLTIIKKEHAEYLLSSLDASITIVNNHWITSLRDTLKELVEIMVTNSIPELDITSLAEYCVLDLIKEDTTENKKVEKLLKLIYG